MKNRDPLAFMFYLQKTYYHHLTFVIMISALDIYQNEILVPEDFEEKKLDIIDLMF